MFPRTAPIGQFFLLAAFTASCYGINSEEIVKIDGKTVGQAVAVVELFTSEGCSSCPPADRLINKIAREAAPAIFVLSYHVDYWDHIGWKDPYSQPLFTARQRTYAKHLSLDNIYTPQVVVNGMDEFVGSDERKLRASLANKSRLFVIPIEATRKTPATIQLSYTLPEAEGLVMHIALIRKKASTKVKSGENGGETLHHINVVQQLKTIETNLKKGTTDLNFPADSNENDFIIIAFTQQKKDYRITSAAQMNIPIR